MSNPIKGRDLVDISDGAIKEATEEIKALKAAHKELLTQATKAQQVNQQANVTNGQGREQIKQLTLEERKLSQAVKANTLAQSKANEELQRLRLNTAKANQIAKANARITKDNAGSYNALSAQYTKNKIKLNDMSKAMRFSTKEGRNLEKQTKKIYQEMTRLQERTGKHSLSVGNYAGKIKQAAGQLFGSLGLIGGVALLGRTILGATQDVIKFSKSQSKLASVLLKSKEDIKELTNEAKLYGLTTAFTATQVTELQTALAKLGFTQDEISLSTKSLIDFATALDVEVGQAAKVGGAALRAFNLDASQMDRVVSVLAVSTTKTASEFEDFDTLISTAGSTANAFGFDIEDLAALFGKLKDSGFEANKAATATRNILLNLADANGALAKKLGGNVKNFDGLIDGLVKLNKEGVSLNETLELTDTRSVNAFNQFLNVGEASRELRDGLIDVNDELGQMVDIQLDNLAGDITLLKSAWQGFILSLESGDGPLAKASRGLVDLATNALIAFSNIDLYLADKMELSLEQVTRGYDSLLALSTKEGEAFRESLDILNKEVPLGEFLDLEHFHFFEVELKKLGYNSKVIQQLWTEFSDRRQKQIDKQNKAEADRDKAEALRKQKEAASALYQNKTKARDAERLAKQKYNAEIAAERLRIDAMENGREKDLARLELTNKIKTKEFEKHKINLQTLEEWHGREVAAINKKYEDKVSKAAKDRVKNIDSFNAKRKADKQKAYNEELKQFDDRQKLADAEFSLLESTEAEKTKFKLNAEKERWEKILKLNEAFGKALTETERKTIQALIQGINNEIAKIEKPVNEDIYDLLGINLKDDEKQAISDSFAFAKDQLDQYTQKRVEAANQNVENAANETQSAENALNREIENRNAGHAHSVETAEKELKAAKKQQKEALNEQKKAQRDQAAIDTLAQTSSLITATAKLWASYAGTGVAAPFAAIAATATMWGSFIASKIKASQLTKKTYGEGGLDILGGGSHASGNDTFMYSTGKENVFGEGGEAVATINKTNTRKYRNLLPTIIDNLNKGTFEHVFTAANKNAQQISVTGGSATDTRKMENLLKDIKDGQSSKNIFTDGEGRTVVEQGDTTKIYV